MCGISGKIYFSPNNKVTEEEIHKMNEKIKHRGPDDEGIYINKQRNVGLGHRRLAIIDLSTLGHQPICNENGTVWVVFNGEIYNFQSLRSNLEKRGHKFKSQTDTETLVHLWEEYSEDCLKYLRGMFAFALWDERKQKLFLARDRLGKKPLKYYIGNDFFVFASELKAFLNTPNVSKEIDLEAIHHYLTFQYVPHPLTGFKGIKKLPPAHYLTIDVSGTVPKISKPTRYWKLDYSKKLNLTEEEWCERIIDKLAQCVKLRLISDVPLGAFLSGGIDSSAIVALMAQNSSQPIKTFSIGFEEKVYNELPHAKLIAQKYGTDHTEFIVTPKEMKHSIDTLVWHYEEPFADSSSLPTYYVSKLTRNHVIVALNGDGGDENFAGYPWYKAHKVASWYQYLPLPLRKINKALFFTIAKSIPSLTLQRTAAFLDSGLLPLHLQYHYYWSIFYPYEKHALYSKKMVKVIKNNYSGDFSSAFYQNLENSDPIDSALYTDINSYLPGALLPKVDIASMAVALEARSPLLDHEFMELCSSIPSSLKLKGFKDKYIFKKSLQNILPIEILTKKKWGFRIPVDNWFKNDLKDMAYDTILSSPLIGELLVEDMVRRLLDEHIQSNISHGRKIWALLWLSLWYQKFFA